MFVTGCRRNLALFATLIVSTTAFEALGKHSHPLWERDLAPHDAVALADSGRCDQESRHFEATAVSHHEACAVCQAATSRTGLFAAPLRLSSSDPTEPDLLARAESLPRSLARSSVRGRAPPLVVHLSA